MGLGVGDEVLVAVVVERVGGEAGAGGAGSWKLESRKGR